MRTDLTQDTSSFDSVHPVIRRNLEWMHSRQRFWKRATVSDVWPSFGKCSKYTSFVLKDSWISSRSSKSTRVPSCTSWILWRSRVSRTVASSSIPRKSSVSLWQFRWIFRSLRRSYQTGKLTGRSCPSWCDRGRYQRSQVRRRCLNPQVVQRTQTVGSLHKRSYESETVDGCVVSLTPSSDCLT